MESDDGTFKPIGLSYSGKNLTGQCIVNEVLQLLRSINATKLYLEEDGSDIYLFMDRGVPGSSLLNQNDNYFYYHHSNGDTMTVENSDALDLCTVVWTVTSYVFANIDQMLPR
jgi:carboxypeptidase Q